MDEKDLKELLKKLEKLLDEGNKLARLERKVLLWFNFLLFLIAIIGVSIWALSELLCFTLQRYEYVQDVLIAIVS